MQKRSLGVCFDFDGSKFVSCLSSGDLFLVKYFIHKLSRCEFILSNCESVKGAFFKIIEFAGKRFLFWPPFPLPAPSISVALTPIFALPKSKKCLAEKTYRNACYAGYGRAGWKSKCSPTITITNTKHKCMRIHFRVDSLQI